MKDIKTKDDIKNSWLIEETYNSEDCRHYCIGGNMEGCCDKHGERCKKETCPLKVGGNNA